jgi:hypothetical protein
MSSSRGGSSQGGRGRGDRQGGGSRLQPGAFDGLSDGDSMSNSGTNFTLPQVRGSQPRVRRGRVAPNRAMPRTALGVGCGVT